MTQVPFCRECGEELVDYFDVEAGICMDCAMDLDPDSFDIYEYESENE